MTNSAALLALRAVAAKAAKLADDLERNKLWEGDLETGIAGIQGDLQDASRAAKGDR